MPNISIYSRDALLSLCSMGTTPRADLLEAVKVPPPRKAQQRRRGKRGGIRQHLCHRSSRPRCWACYSAMHDPCGVKWTSFGITQEHVLSTGSRACWCSQKLGSIWIFQTPSSSWKDSLLSVRTGMTLRGSVVGESSADVELLRLSPRPLYLPREFRNIIICVVYGPPSDTPSLASSSM